MRIKASGHGRDERPPPEDCACGVCETVELLGRKWTLDVMGILSPSETVRFNALQRELGRISPRTLSDRLSQLEEAGVVDRIDHEETPPRVEYVLTEKGEALAEALEPLVAWAQEHGGGT